MTINLGSVWALLGLYRRQS